MSETPEKKSPAKGEDVRKEVEVKELPTSPEDLKDEKAEDAKGGLAKSRGPAGMIWWNPIPVQPVDALKGGRKSRVGAYRKGGRAPQG